jgi:hypothetical protein
VKAIQRDQLLIHLAAKLAKIDAEITALGPFLACVVAELEDDPKRKAALIQRFVSLLDSSRIAKIPTLVGSVEHIREQFPEFAKIYEDSLEISEKDISTASADMSKILKRLFGKEQDPT